MRNPARTTLLLEYAFIGLSVSYLQKKRKNFYLESSIFTDVMEINFSEKRILVDLGLTSTQAKVYSALADHGIFKISEISKKANVARPELYQTLSALEQLGLVEKIIQKPIAYKAIPMKSGVSLLLERKRQQYRRVRAEARLLEDTARGKSDIITNPKSIRQFILIPKGSAINRIATAINNAKESVSFVLSWKKFVQLVTGTLSEALEEAWAKNVKTRFIVESPPDNKTAEQILLHCENKPSCEIKLVCFFPNTNFMILDQKELLMIMRPRDYFRKNTILWSNNLSMISLAKDHFEILWSLESKFNINES
jgi:sugar-specific transcriptional regulator TrmB